MHELTRQFDQPTRKVTHLFHCAMAPAEKIYLESTKIAPVIIIVTIVVGDALLVVVEVVVIVVVVGSVILQVIANCSGDYNSNYCCW